MPGGMGAMLVSPCLAVGVILGQGGGRASAWEDFAPANGGFRVSLPGKPIEKKRTVNLAGTSVQFQVASVKMKGVTAYSVAYGGIEAGGDVEGLLDAARDEVLATAKATLKDEKKVDVSGSPGR